MIETVLIHPVALLNVSDHATRELKSTIGILLGSITDTIATVNTSFEILTKDGLVDYEYLIARYEQFVTIFPQYKVVGMYQISHQPPRGLSVIQEVTSTISSFQGGFSTINDRLHLHDMVVTIFNRQMLLKEGGTTRIYQSYSYPDNAPIKTIISPSESEVIATSTVVHNKIYSDSTSKSETFANDLSVEQHTQNLALSATQLKEKIYKIVNYLEQAKTTNLDDRISINNLITHLANKLALLRESGREDDEQVRLRLGSTELSLLTKELALIDGVRTSLYKKMLQSPEV